MADGIVPKGVLKAHVGWTAAYDGLFLIGSSLIGSTDVLGSSITSPITGADSDISDRVVSFSTDRGAVATFAGAEAGGGAITLRDPEGDFNPANELSPIADVIDERLHPIRLEMSFESVDRPLFAGWIRRITGQPSNRLSTASFELVDLFYWLDTLYPTIASTGSTTTGAVIGLILDEIGWGEPSGRDLNVGDIIADFSADGTETALSLIRGLLEAERGHFWITPGGVATYRSRHAGLHDVIGWRPAAQVSPNNTFDADIVGWIADGGSSVSWLSTDGFRSNGCLECVTTGINQGVRSNSADADFTHQAVAGDTVRARVAVKPITSTLDTGLQFHEYNGTVYTGTSSTQLAAGVLPADEWTVLDFEYTVQNPATDRVRFDVDDRQAPARTFRVDDVEIDIADPIETISDEMRVAAPSIDFDRIRTKARVTLEGGTEQTHENTDKSLRFGVREVSPITTPYLPDDTGALGLAQHLVYAHGDPRSPLRPLTVEARTDALMRQILTIGIGDTIEATEAQTGTSGTWIVRNLGHSFNGSRLAATYQLQGTPKTRPFVIGRSRIGGITDDNVLTNPGAETGDTTGWLKGGTNAIEAVELDPRSGTYAFKATRNDAGNGFVLYQSVTLANLGEQRFGAWVKIPADYDGGIKLQARDFLGVTGVNEEIAADAAEREWQFLAFSFTPEDEDLTGNIMVNSTPNPTMGRHVFVDDLFARPLRRSDDRLVY